MFSPKNCYFGFYVEVKVKLNTGLTDTFLRYILLPFEAPPSEIMDRSVINSNIGFSRTQTIITL